LKQVFKLLEFQLTNRFHVAVHLLSNRSQKAKLGQKARLFETLPTDITRQPGHAHFGKRVKIAISYKMKQFHWMFSIMRK